MRLEHIRSFIGVVNSKSFSVAAKKLFISQPTISTHIKQLEAELGAQLLVRSTKDVILSEAGVTFYPYAVKLLEVHNEALAQLAKNEVDVNAVINIASSTIPGNYILPGFISYSRKKYPGITYKIMNGDSSEVLRLIQYFEADVGLGCKKGLSDKCVSVPVMKDEIVLITPNTESYRKMEGVFPAERLKKEVFIKRTNDAGGFIEADSIEKELGLTEENTAISFRADSSETVKRGVAEGLGIAFISRLLAKEAIDQKQILSFHLPNIMTDRDIFLIYHKDQSASQSVATVSKMIQKYCQNLQRDC